jgi:hypothetical protein
MTQCISLRSVQRIWEGSPAQAASVRSFKRSRDPAFAEKPADIVGLYVDLPAHGVVLSIGGENPDPGAGSHSAGGALAWPTTSSTKRRWA